MFASGYVPGQIANLLADSDVKPKNTELAMLFKSPNSKKKKKRASTGTSIREDGEGSTSGIQNNVVHTSEDEPIKKKKKKKKTVSSNSEDNDATNAAVSDDSQNASPMKKKKKKNILSNDDVTEATISEDSQNVSPKKKKKTKKAESANSSESTESSPNEGNMKSERLSAEDEETSKEKRMVPKKPKQKLPTDPDATVFVGNLPNSTDKKVVKKIFKKYGKVVSVRFRNATPADPKVPKKVAAIKKEFHDSRNNINAYVVFENKEQAQGATKANGVLVNKFTIRVDLLQGSKKHDHIRSVFVGNLPFNVEEEPLREHFADCGDIENVRVIRDNKSGLGKGFGYVLFKEKSGASFATHLNGEAFQGRKLRIERSVEPAKPKPKEKVQKSTEVGQKKKKERHRLRMPTNASSKDYEGIHAQKMEKMKKKQKFKKKNKKFAKLEELAKKDPKTFKRPPKGKKTGENARFRMSLKQKQKNKS